MKLEAGTRTLDLRARPLVMGILNATPDSFYDGGRDSDLEACVERGLRLLEAGADLVELGGESGVTNQPQIDERREAARIVPVIERLAAVPGAIVSVDTFKPSVARAAIAAGATIVNDPSGLSRPEIADVCAASGAALVVTHTRARPKQKLEAPRYADLIEDVKRFLRARIALAAARGVEHDRLIVCPGPDLGKQPAQTIELLRRLAELEALGRPILLAVSRKDFVGALLEQPPRSRLAGTLAAVAHGVARGARIVRVHDVAETRDFLTVRAALEGQLDVPDGLRLADRLRREQPERVDQTQIEEATV